MLKFLQFAYLFAALVFAWEPTVGSGYAKPAPVPILHHVDLSDSGIGNGRPLVIEFSPGGAVFSFIAKAGELAFDRTPVIVDGPCMSACTMLVDLDRQNVCLTTNAVFGYHQSYWEDAEGTYHYQRIPLETPGLDKYLDLYGGPPADRFTLLMVPFEHMKQFYKPCAGAA